ncbi:MAG: lipopolysaccharide transport periplasmic protein LptA [Gammaproteobacteria bacterium]|nr:lipopolysaccharide transport periplasmic protein LptA [Gammaproteobacteria bacterium]
MTGASTMSWRAALWLAAWLAMPAAQALAADRDQPTQIRADHIEANQQTGVVTYRGHVSFSRGGIDIQADQVEVRSRGEQLQSVSAYGAPVRFRQQADGARAEIRGQAARVDYRADSRVVVLRGQARLEQHGDVFEAAILNYQLDRSDLRAEGAAGQDRIQAVLTPRQPGRNGSPP